ncbi:hypothetical protein [Comamonas sp. JC664]|uniref:hypothetical protein n=1 Tax=Comamonas sp. JC664 TaxID=2801917 RepID=UPI00174E732D|nr:hypothetical protein [Comamonas sp. JC664]MBL0695512.1 hypothetical protein [Comamonas sp. JC664]GHG61946.1 hypothetical protein GCM10012319_00240 [Comamonas sp. KCTC 72670]
MMIAVRMVELLLAIGAEVEGCESLQQLVERILRVADTNMAINKEEEEPLAARIQSHGAAAIPLVIPLLDSESEATRARMETFNWLLPRTSLRILRDTP